MSRWTLTPARLSPAPLIRCWTRQTRPEHYEQLKGQKCAAHLIRPDEQGRRDYAGILQGLDADGNVTLTDGEETYAFPVKSAGYVKLCDDEDLFG